MAQHNRQHRRQFEITDSRRLHWYAAVFDEITTIQERDRNGKVVSYRESIAPGAFAAALAQGQPVVANIDHDNTRTFATTEDGTLLLQEDGKGLYCSCWLPEGEQFDRIIEDVIAGKLDGASFRFSPVKDRTNGDLVERLQVNLYDCCLTSHPAYPETLNTVYVRTNNERSRILFSRLKLVKIRSKSLHTTNNPGA